MAIKIQGSTIIDDGRNIIDAGISTISGVTINSGIVTAAVGTGIVTYYGDGGKLENIIVGVGINSDGQNLGYGATVLDFRGSGISTITVSSGIGTIYIEGGSGTSGSQGIQGLQGTQGVQGLQGIGFQGTQGTQGVQGLQGTGFQGTQGIQGLQGIGFQGTQGLQGVGSQGLQGLQGVQGIGFQGIQGLQGVQGIGFQGIQGASGSGGGSSSWIKKTTTYTAVAGDKIIADTSSGIFTINLPSTPTLGDSVLFADGGDWNTNNLTVGSNGSTIEGSSDDFILDIKGIEVEFIYDGSTWEVYASVGPAGLQGTHGIQGLQGTQGLQGLQGVTGTFRIFNQSTPPSAGVATVGDYWVDNSDGTTYFYYDDGNSIQWIEFGPTPQEYLNIGINVYDGSFVGFASVIDFGKNLSVTPISSGIVTVNASSNYTFVNSNYTIQNSDSIISASGTIQLTLPTAIGASGHKYYVKNVGIGTVTIVPYGSELIDDYSNMTLNQKNSSLILISDNSKWLIF